MGTSQKDVEDGAVGGQNLNGLLTVLVVVAVLVLVGLALSVRIVQQYEKGVLFASAGSSGSASPA